LLTIATNYAQSSAEQAGIAVQGIARNANNTAIVSENLSFSFELYYKDAADQKQTIGSIETLNLKTDAFGVFSHIIDPTAANNVKFANYQVYLRIAQGSEEISNEKLKHVPYAISANNGVPTGSIMPWIGDGSNNFPVPSGWVLCNGQNLNSIVGSEALIAMLGVSTAPKLQGMFLRGAGTNTNTGAEFVGKDGPALKQKQGDGFESHLHDDGTLKAASAGAHTHESKHVEGSDNTSNRFGATFGDGGGDSVVLAADTFTTSSDGSHGHDVTGNTGSTGISETRPVNYGVNYIIKL
jgi:microcystin-dependent protein